MKIIEKNDYLSFEQTEDFEKELVSTLNKLKAKLDGFVLKILTQNDELLCMCDLVDNSVFLVQVSQDAYKVANLLGAKRFMPFSSVPPEGAMRFPRDRLFPINHKSIMNEANNIKVVIGIDQIKKLISEDQLYKDLSRLFNECAKFSEGKQIEYSQNKLSEKYCRFNSPAITGIFLLSKNEVIGCIRLAHIYNGDKLVVYVSDEIVNPAFGSQKELFSLLFSEAGKLMQGAPQLKYAFIRVASGREEMYEALGCSKENSVYVQHGDPTVLLNSIKEYAVGIAREKLVKLSDGKGLNFRIPPMVELEGQDEIKNSHPTEAFTK